MQQPTQQIQNDSKYSVRTQISLSPKLRKLVAKKTSINKESMSEYIRKAIEIRIKAEEADDEKGMDAVRAFVGAGKGKNYPEWSSKEKIIKWQREMREDPPRLYQ